MAITDNPLGGARRFNGTTDFITLAGENGYDFTTALTVSAWIRVAGFELTYQAIVTKGDSTWRIHREADTNHLGFGTTNNNNNDNREGATNVNDAQWHYAAIVYDGAKKLLYVDDKQDVNASFNATLDLNNMAVEIGHNPEATTGNHRFWHGDLDEIRISNTAKPPAWIGAEYVTATNAAFVMVGADERY
jgi:Concanavalin A-like lectin/glucanases superfamily